jgi:hypothetical protein
MMDFLNGKKCVAWGKGTLLHNYLQDNPTHHGISYIVDSFQKEASEHLGLKLLPLEALKSEDREKLMIVTFSVCNQSRREIRAALNSMGFSYAINYIDCADLFRDKFERKLREFLGRAPITLNYDLARHHDNNSFVPVQTTICGSWLLLECLRDTKNIPGPIVEIGAYRGGNATLMLQALAHADDSRKYFIMDSFEGFPELHEYDPKHTQSGFDEEYNYCEIYDRFVMFDNAEIIRGFVPSTFARLPKNEKFSLVFFDCDLYEPAVATLDYFWDRLNPGGYILLHDYMHAEFGGVTKAVDEFCAKKQLVPTVFYENTMACFKKK